eukprot:2820750-Pleurochrysis_carterae.AAC.3
MGAHDACDARVRRARACGKGGEGRVLREEERGHVELLEEQLGRLLSRGGRVERRLGHQQRVLARVAAEAVLVRVLDQRLRHVPVGDDAVGERRDHAHAVAPHRERARANVHLGRHAARGVDTRTTLAADDAHALRRAWRKVIAATLA